MKKALFILAATGLLFLVNGQPAQAQSANEEKQAAGETIKPQNVGNKICPVSGEKVGKMGPAVEYEYNGKIYNFCCAGCIEAFMKDPAKYIKIIEENQAKENGGNK